MLEFEPVTLEIKWKYTGAEAGYADLFRFYSPYISAAQRLPNGNTMITEGSDGRIFEVTPDHQIVWEYVNPYYRVANGFTLNMVYRAYRVPYEWVPQAPKPDEQPVYPLNIAGYRVPGSVSGVHEENTVTVAGVDPGQLKALEDPLAYSGTISDFR